MADANRLFNDDEKPILECLTNVNVETWRTEGLFKRAQILDNNKNMIEIAVGKKMRFCQMLISRWFEIRNGGPLEMKSGGAGPRMTKTEILTDNHFQIKRMFAVAKDERAAGIVLNFITREPLCGARYYAKQNKIVWPQFVLWFNEVLEQVMMGCEYV